jgi:5-methylcytosine-specific restriction endonuclease McrA
MAHEDSVNRLKLASEQLLRFVDRLETGEAGRDDLDRIVADIVGAQRAYFGPRPRASRGQGAKRKILDYLKQRVEEPVYGEELAVIGGIQDWPRRIRELRVEDGYDILELGNGSGAYRLERIEPNIEKAGEWQLANEIRKSPGSARKRIERFLEANVGEVVNRKQIDYVSGIAEGSRRVRELRDNAGWPIASHIDEQDLRPEEYRLLSVDPQDRRDSLQRLYPENLRQRVFARDSYTCKACGRNREKALAAGDTRFYLEVHHLIAVADEVASLPKRERNNIENLITLCHADHLKETAKLQKRKARERRSSS